MNLERFALVVATVALGGLATLRYTDATVNVTDSEPTGLYLRIPGSPARDGMVALRPLIKHVAATAGDVVTVTPQGTYVNGRLWPESAIPAHTHGYQPFPFGTYTLEPGQYRLLGTSPDSWDSRFIGPVPLDLVESSIRPLCTFGNPQTKKKDSHE
jgi:type IV secretory pathway protease TraF